MYPIGLSTCGKHIDAALFADYAKNDITAMELSLHDYTGFDFPAVAALARASGVWLYEIGFACPKTIFRDRPLTCADFARNAQELFAGKAPTVISTPKPNLGMWE